MLDSPSSSSTAPAKTSPRPRRRTVGILVNAASLAGRQIARGVLNWCSSNGEWDYHIEKTVEISVFHRLMLTARNWRMDAIIGQIWYPSMFDECIAAGVPVIDVSGVLALPRAYHVHVDNHAVGRMVAGHLIDKGIRRFAFCGFPAALHSRERYEGFHEVVSQHGYEVLRFDQRMPTPNSRTNAMEFRQGLMNWLASLPRPCGLMAVNDLRGGEILRACRDGGIRVPEEIAVVGVDNDDFTCATSPVPLSSVDIGPFRVGQEAAALMDRIVRRARRDQDDAAMFKPVLVPPVGIVARRSSEVLVHEDANVELALRYIDEHLSRPIGVADLLRAVPVSRRSLEKLFRAALGRSPAQQICRMRVERAKSLMLGTELKLAEIAIRCGFANATVLGQCFRRETGATPSIFRSSAVQ